MAFDARDDIRVPVPATRRHVEREDGPLANSWSDPADEASGLARRAAGGLVGLDRERRRIERDAVLSPRAYSTVIFSSRTSQRTRSGSRVKGSLQPPSPAQTLRKTSPRLSVKVHFAGSACAVGVPRFRKFPHAVPSRPPWSPYGSWRRRSVRSWSVPSASAKRYSRISASPPRKRRSQPRRPLSPDGRLCLNGGGELPTTSPRRRRSRTCSVALPSWRAGSGRKIDVTSEGSRRRVATPVFPPTARTVQPVSPAHERRYRVACRNRTVGDAET